MRILWVKVGGLWPANVGGRLRSFHMIAELTRRHEVIIATTHGPKEDPDSLAENLGERARVVSVPFVAPHQGQVRFAAALARSWLSPAPLDARRYHVDALHRAVDQLLETQHIDVCIADFLAATPNVSRQGRIPVVLFEHNVEHVLWRRLGENERRPWRRAILAVEWRKMRRFEANACASARLTVAVSEKDRTTLAQLAPQATIRAVPTGVDTEYFRPNGTPEAANALVFCGAMDWHPNEDAVRYLLDDILPRIRHVLPATALTVVGRNPTPALKRLAAAHGVHVTGTVDDVRPTIAAGAVFVVPLRVGGGTRLKILEALAMGKAVVSTTIGAEGLPLVRDEHYVCADGPVDLAKSVVELLQNPARRRALGDAGRLLAETYGWQGVSRAFEACCEEATHAS